MPWLNIDWKQILDIGSYHRHLGNTLFFDKTDIFSRFFLTWNRKEYSDKTLLYFLLDTRGKRKEHTQCRVFSGPYFPLSELNMEIYGVNLLIQSEYRKIRTRKNFVFGQFSRSVCFFYVLYPEEMQGFFWTSYVHFIYFLCPGSYQLQP